MHTHFTPFKELDITSRGASFQFEFDGSLFAFSHARPAFPPLLRLPRRQGTRTPALFEPLKAETAYAYPMLLMIFKRGWLPLQAMQPAYPAFYLSRQAEAPHTRTRTTDQGSHPRTRGRQPRHCGDYRDAREHERPRRSNHRRPI